MRIATKDFEALGRAIAAGITGATKEVEPPKAKDPLTDAVRAKLCGATIPEPFEIKNLRAIKEPWLWVLLAAAHRVSPSMVITEFKTDGSFLAGAAQVLLAHFLPELDHGSQVVARLHVEAAIVELKQICLSFLSHSAESGAAT